MLLSCRCTITTSDSVLFSCFYISRIYSLMYVTLDIFRLSGGIIISQTSLIVVLRPSESGHRSVTVDTTLLIVRDRIRPNSFTLSEDKSWGSVATCKQTLPYSNTHAALPTCMKSIHVFCVTQNDTGMLVSILGDILSVWSINRHTKDARHALFL